MRFAQKLQKIRKEKNLSQEELASRLDVSRQAVSKWESGNSYPDMEKMLQICNILDCKLTDIMDDGAINDNQTSTNKDFTEQLKNYFNEFLSMITKIYNMLCSMETKQRITCIIEMFILGILLIIGSLIIESIAQYIILSVFNIFPFTIMHYGSNIILTLIKILLSITSFVVFIHIFKIRYLDYYVTVEDKNSNEKTIEKPVEAKEDKNYTAPVKEKIVIRDPKHSNFNFFKLISDFIIFIIKLIIIPLIIVLVIFYILLMIMTTYSFFNLIYNTIFIIIGFGFLGGAIVCCTILKVLFNFIFNQEIYFKGIYSSLITGISIVAISIGLFIPAIMSFDIVYVNDLVLSDTIDIKLEKNEEFIINEYYGINTLMDQLNIEYIVDETLENVTFEIYNNKYTNYTLTSSTYNDKKYFINIDYINFIDMYNLVIDDIKDSKISTYTNEFKIKIYCSSKDCEYIENNIK